MEAFGAANRKPPSIRTMQRYCQEGRFDCFKLKTTRNGNPVHEWIINSTSLRKFIATKPKGANHEASATPAQSDDANGVTETPNSIEETRFVTAPPDRIDDVNVEHGYPRTPTDLPNVVTTPETNDDANPEQRSRVDLMIENAKLTARLDSQEELIGELREDKKFMREQITHQRQNDSLMSDMHRETLHALKAVSVAGRHTRIEMPDAPPASEQGHAFYDEPRNGQPRNAHGDDGV